MLDMLEFSIATALFSRLDSLPQSVYLVGSGVAVIVIALVFLRLARNVRLSDQPLKEKPLHPVAASSRKWYSRAFTLTALLTIASLLLLHHSSSNGIARPHQHLTGDSIVSSEVIDYLDRLRTDWGIPGVSIAIVRQREDDAVWEHQTIGLGRKDASGHQVTDRVSCV